MSIVLFEFGAICVMTRYLQLKGNVFYFRRRVPDDVQRHYRKLNKRNEIFFSLKTGDAQEAARLASLEAIKQDNYWQALRGGVSPESKEMIDAAIEYLRTIGLEPGQHKDNLDEEGGDLAHDRLLEDLHFHSGILGPEDGPIIKDRLPPYLRMAAELYYGQRTVPKTLSDAVELHNRFKADDYSEKYLAAQKRALDLVYQLIGNLVITAYTREHVKSYVDYHLSQGRKTDTIRRYINYISPIFNTAIHEYSLLYKNPFEKPPIPSLGKDRSERPPFTTEEIRSLQEICFDADDQMQWIVALVSDTGARVAEIVGLKLSDIRLDDPVPHINLEPNDLRRLKSKSSKRKVPLVGASLWAARRVVASKLHAEVAFPRFVRKGEAHAHTASNQIAKWLRQKGFDKTSHSLRHSMRDRLRNVGCPPDVADRIGGWSAEGRSVGERYGAGHDLEVLAGWLEKIALVDPDRFQ